MRLASLGAGAAIVALGKTLDIESALELWGDEKAREGGGGGLLAVVMDCLVVGGMNVTAIRLFYDKFKRGNGKLQYYGIDNNCYMSALRATCLPGKENGGLPLPIFQAFTIYRQFYDRRGGVPMAALEVSERSDGYIHY